MYRFLSQRPPVASLALLACLLGTTASCEAEFSGEVRVGYDTMRVTEADDAVLIGGDSPGGYYTAYEVEPNYPLTIESTAYLEEQTQPRAMEEGSDTGTDTGGGERAEEEWVEVGVASGELSLASDSECTVAQPPECDGEGCTFQLEMPGDGVCIAELTLTAEDGRFATDCWGFGWTDGRGRSPDQRDQRTEGMIQKRDEYCR